MKFIHCADVHLDSPLRGLAAYEGAPVDEIRGATRRALEALIDLCLEEEVDFVVIAGDLFDGGWRDFNTGLFFANQVQRLAERRLPVFIALGNHDAEGQLTRRLRFPDNVHLFPSARPATVRLDHLGVSVHGQSFATRDVTANLALAYPPPVAGHLNVGVLHTAVTGREGHALYAPCEVGQLVDRGYDYWALGHVHRREVLHERPWIVFPGNLQGRHIKEPGDKGCSLVSIENGTIARVDHRPVDSVRWRTVEVDATGAETEADVLDRARHALGAALHAGDGHLLAARVVVSGACPAHGALTRDAERIEQEIRIAAIEAGRERIWLERVVLAIRVEDDPTHRLPVEGPAVEIARHVRAVIDDDAELATLEAALGDLRAKLPAELREGDEALALAGAGLRAWLPEVESLVLARLAREAVSA